MTEDVHGVHGVLLCFMSVFIYFMNCTFKTCGCGVMTLIMFEVVGF